MQRRIYKGEEHPEIATTLISIGELWSNFGSYLDALKQFENVLGKNWLKQVLLKIYTPALQAN